LANSKVNPLFSVEILTYNHEEYVAQTLESILTQQHDYRYEIIIGDDYSSDNTRQILLTYKEKYPDIITLIFNKTNLGLIKNFFNVLDHCSGKYIMDCAGDDYWIQGKVQTQIAFMEAHPDAGMCYGKLKEFDQNTGQFIDIRGGANTTFETLIEKNTIPVLTTCLKHSVFNAYITEMEPANKPWNVEDFPMWLWFAFRSKIYFIDSIFGVYRRLSGSISHPTTIQKKIDFELSINLIRSFYCEYFSVPFNAQIKEDEIYRNAIRDAVYNKNTKLISAISKKIQTPLKKDNILFLTVNPFFCRIMLLWYKLKEIKKKIKNKQIN